MTQGQLKETIRLHGMWQRGEDEGVRADLSFANLSNANLSNAVLRFANLVDADMYGANLRGANLSNADLRGANLSNAVLRFANLTGADLEGADLSGADLESADLYGANLSGANLSNADLFCADLKGTDLRFANLSKADLSYANLRDANLSGAIWDETPITDEEREALWTRVKDQVLTCPETWDQSSWHSDCGTTHCIAGWAETLTHRKELAERLADGPAGFVLLPERIHHLFYNTDTAHVQRQIQNL